MPDRKPHSPTAPKPVKDDMNAQHDCPNMGFGNITPTRNLRMAAQVLRTHPFKIPLALAGRKNRPATMVIDPYLEYRL